MKLTLVLFLSVVFAELVLGTENYSDSYDNVDVDAIISSERLFNQYLDCILDKGPCTADGRSLKRVLPDAIATACEKCNAKQRQMARKVIVHVKQHRPQAWATLLERYDPNKEYVGSFERFLARVD